MFSLVFQDPDVFLYITRLLFSLSLSLLPLGIRATVSSRITGGLRDDDGTPPLPLQMAANVVIIAANYSPVAPLGAWKKFCTQAPSARRGVALISPSTDAQKNQT